MTLLVMTPVWTRVYDDAIKPYSDSETEMTLAEAYEAGALPVREFMSKQIAAAKTAPTSSCFIDTPTRRDRRPARLPTFRSECCCRRL